MLTLMLVAPVSSTSRSKEGTLKTRLRGCSSRQTWTSLSRARALISLKKGTTTLHW